MEREALFVEGKRNRLGGRGSVGGVNGVLLQDKRESELDDIGQVDSDQFFRG